MTLVTRSSGTHKAVPLMLCDMSTCMSATEVRCATVIVGVGGAMQNVKPPVGWYSVLVETWSGKRSFDACSRRHLLVLVGKVV